MTPARLPLALVLLGALASAAPAQTAADWVARWNAHAPAEPIKPLDDLVPQDVPPDLPDWAGTAPNPQAQPAQGADLSALADLFGETAAATPAPPPAPAPAPAAIPDDWITYTPLGTRFRLPPDWVLVGERDNQAVFFKGDIASKIGVSFGVSFLRDMSDERDVPAQMAAEPTAKTLPDVTFAQGQIFHRLSIRPDLQAGLTVEIQSLFSEQVYADNAKMMIAMISSGIPYADNAATFEMILSSFEPPPPPAVAAQVLEPVLHGLIPFAMPSGFSLMEGGVDEDYYTTISDIYDKMILFAMGDRVSGATGWLATMPPGTTGTADIIMGQPALRFEWISLQPDVYENGVVVPAHNKLWLLNDCAPQGQPVAVTAWGTTAFIESTEPTDILNALQLSAPLIPCGIGPDAAVQTPDAQMPAPQMPAVEAPTPGLPAIQPPAPQTPDPQSPDPDTFTDQGGDHTLYQNGRYGTFLTYPSPYFQPDPPPENGDGRHFTSTDGQADLTVFTQQNVMGYSTADLAVQARNSGAYDSVTYQKIEPGWSVLSGTIGDRIFYRRAIDEGPDGLVRVFEITYPAARKDEFDAIVTNIAESFGPGTSMDAAPTLTLGPIYTPIKKTAERKALIDAARVPIQLFLAQPTSFVVEVLHTDGVWAYLKGKPVHADNSPIDWSITPYAEAMANGTMSDFAMVLMQYSEGAWSIVDFAIGPPEDYWTDWVDIFGVPQAMFLKD